MNKNFLLKTKVLFLFLFLALWAKAEETYYKEIRRNLTVNENVLLDLDIHFANVDIKTAQGNQLEIVVKMDVSAKNEDRANEMFGSFMVNISEGSDRVGVSVGGGKWSCNSKNSESYQIRVEMIMPLNAVLDGVCTFGDVNIGDMMGACLLNLEYGSARINGLWSYSNDFRVAFGDASINGTNGGFYRNEYGALKLGLLQGNAEIKSSFGDLDISKVAKECKDLEVKVEYADAEIEIAPDAGFRINAESSYGDVELPSSIKTTLIKEDFSGKRIQGTIGSGDGKMDIECDFGDLDVEID
jgi:hypothetical protein